jgi:hypothetical protein
MNATSTAFCHNIIQLDHFNRKMGRTLQQAVMHISSPTRSNMNLFVAVDTTFDGSGVHFAFRSELEWEAQNMISALPIFLEAITGKSAVWNWFTKEAQHGADQYMWDPDKGIFEIPKDQEDEEAQDAETTVEEDIGGWEDLNDSNDIGDNNDHIFHPIELNLNKLRANPYNDKGTIKTNIYEDCSVAPDIQVENDISEEASNAKNQAQVAIPITRRKTVIIDVDKISPSNSKKPSKPCSVHTATTTSSKTPSTLTKTPDRSTMISELAADPAFASDPLMAEAFKKLALHFKGKTGLTSETDCDAVDV